jgi:hypothetical protein
MLKANGQKLKAKSQPPTLLCSFVGRGKPIAKTPKKIEKPEQKNCPGFTLT